VLFLSLTGVFFLLIFEIAVGFSRLLTPALYLRFAMAFFQRLLKFGYVIALGSAVIVLSQPAPVRAQRAIAFRFLPSPFTNTFAMSMLAASASTPLRSYQQVQQQLMQAQQALDPFGVGQSGGMGLLGNTVATNGLGGGNGGMMGMGGGMRAIGGGMMGLGGMMGMGGLRGIGGMMGMGGLGGFGGGRGGFGGVGGGFGGAPMGGIGGMGGFAGKGFGGFNGKKAL
jgi:hypothetical protein